MCFRRQCTHGAHQGSERLAARVMIAYVVPATSDAQSDWRLPSRRPLLAVCAGFVMEAVVSGLAHGPLGP
jgi:hypothetical protein